MTLDLDQLVKVVELVKDGGATLSLLVVTLYALSLVGRSSGTKPRANGRADRPRSGPSSGSPS